MSTTLERRTLLSATLASLLSGCMIVPLGSRYPAPPPDGPVAPTPPPEPPYEGVGVAPEVGLIWLAGFWLWASGAWHWRPGHWERARPGHHWVPHRWERGPRGWYERPGYWRRH